MTVRAKLLVVAALLLGASACKPEPPPPLVRGAKFGIFFGGQIEERREIPFQLDRTRQTQGFRVEFSLPLTEDTPIEWRIDVPKAKPTPAKKTAKDVIADAPPPPRALSGVDHARPGETRFDRETPFEPGDPLGLWNVRVVVRGKVVIDRPVEVYDAAARAKMMPRDAGAW
jgi:hypothetical protein